MSPPAHCVLTSSFVAASSLCRRQIFMLLPGVSSPPAPSVAAGFELHLPLQSLSGASTRIPCSAHLQRAVILALPLAYLAVPHPCQCHRRCCHAATLLRFKCDHRIYYRFCRRWSGGLACVETRVRRPVVCLPYSQSVSHSVLQWHFILIIIIACCDSPIDFGLC